MVIATTTKRRNRMRGPSFTNEELLILQSFITSNRQLTDVNLALLSNSMWSAVNCKWKRSTKALKIKIYRLINGTEKKKKVKVTDNLITTCVKKVIEDIKVEAYEDIKNLKVENQKLKDELYECKELLRKLKDVRMAVEAYQRQR